MPGLNGGGGHDWRSQRRHIAQGGSKWVLINRSSFEMMVRVAFYIVDIPPIEPFFSLSLLVVDACRVAPNDLPRRGALNAPGHWKDASGM